MDETLQKYLEGEFSALKESQKRTQTELLSLREYCESNFQIITERNSSQNSLLGALKGKVALLTVIIGTTVGTTVGAVLSFLFYVLSKRGGF